MGMNWVSVRLFSRSQRFSASGEHQGFPAMPVGILAKKDADLLVRPSMSLSRPSIIAVAVAIAVCRGLAVRVSKISKIDKLLQIFGGLVLGCIKTKFCKKICV